MSVMMQLQWMYAGGGFTAEIKNSRLQRNIGGYIVRRDVPIVWCVRAHDRQKSYMGKSRHPEEGINIYCTYTSKDIKNREGVRHFEFLKKKNVFNNNNNIERWWLG